MAAKPDGALAALTEAILAAAKGDIAQGEAAVPGRSRRQRRDRSHEARSNCRWKSVSTGLLIEAEFGSVGRRTHERARTHEINECLQRGPWVRTQAHDERIFVRPAATFSGFKEGRLNSYQAQPFSVYSYV